MFRHALLAEAVHAELLPGERVRLHRAGRRPGGRPGGRDAPASRAARLAYHWAAAGDQPRALTASLAAAAAAEGVYAFAEARLRLERVLKLWERVPDAEARAGMDRVALLARCAEAAYAAGDPAGAAELVRQAIALVDRRGSRCGPGCCTSSWPAACAGSATPPRWARSSRRCGWCRPRRRRSGRGCSARSRSTC